MAFQDDPTQTREASMYATGKRSRSDAYGDNCTELEKGTPVTVDNGLGSSSEVERMDGRLLSSGGHAATGTVETTELTAERLGNDKNAKHTLELMLMVSETRLLSPGFS